MSCTSFLYNSVRFEWSIVGFWKEIDRKSQRCGSIQAGCTKSKAYERTNIKSFASRYKDCGGSMGVRVFSEHRCEAAAPTEPAGETQRPRSPTVVARRKCLWERGRPLVWVMEERACCRKAAKEGKKLLKEKSSTEKAWEYKWGMAAAFSNY